MKTAINEHGSAHITLDAITLKSLQPVSLGLSMLYAIFAISHKFLHPPDSSLLMIAVATATAVLFFGLYCCLHWRAVPVKWAHPLGAVVAISVLFNCLLNLYLLSDPQQTTNVALLIIGVGCFFLSTRWLALVFSISIGGWAAVAFAIGASPLWFHFGFLMLSATTLSILIYIVRVRIQVQLEIMRLQDSQRKIDLETALHAVQLSEERYRSVVDNIKEVIFQTDPLGTWIFLNPAWTEITGFTVEQSIGKNCLKFIHPDDRERNVKLWQSLIERQEEYCRQEIRYISAGGDCRWLEVYAHLTFDEAGCVNGVYGTLNDITERAAAVEALRKSEEYHNLFQLANDPILIFKPEGEIVLDVNDKACQTYGIPRRAFIGKSLKDISAETARSERYLSRLLAAGTAQEFETVQFHADGTPICFLINASVIEYQGHRAILSINRDITDRKRAEEALRESEDHLRQSQKMEAIGQLAGGVAHDFNNLLTAISGYSDLSLRQLRPDDRLRQNIEEIKKAADRAAGLTRQLLAFSRRQVLQPKVLNLNMVVADMHKLLRRLIGEDIELITICKSPAEIIYADPGQIEQVVMNLAVNARDAMPRGGRLIIETSNVELNEEYTQRHVAIQPGHYVRLVISDTGCGMDAETQNRIFEPFFTTKKMGKGTGLGLSTVYGIVKQSGGHIWVYSEVGHGTTFKIYLPRAEQVIDYTNAEDTGSALLNGTETVLLVEDEEIVRDMTRKSLELTGYKVLEAASGGEAMMICESHADAIQLLLTDVVMPEMSGRELAECLKKVRPEMKTLYMSGYTDEAIVNHGILAPNTAFLEKPFTPDSLARKLREVLDAKAVAGGH